MNAYLITEQSAERSLGNERQAQAVKDCISQSASTQPVVHVRKDGTRLVSNDAGSWFAITRNGSTFEPDDYTSEAEDAFLAEHAEAISAFAIAA